MQIAKAKSEIINNIKKDGFIVLNADDKFFSFHKKKAIKKKLNIISFGFSQSADVRFLKINKIKNFYKIIVKIFNQNKTFQIKYKYQNYIKNILSALAILYILDKTKKLKLNFFKDFMIPEGRGDILKIKLKNKNIYLIDESYNSNPLSLKAQYHQRFRYSN